MQLIVDEARSVAALTRAGIVRRFADRRVVTAQAAGNLQMVRRNMAQGGQTLIFSVTVLLATLLLSNLAEEKSNKVIEVLAAAVPLDAVFFGKLIAMLGISFVGLALWGGIFGLGYAFVQVLQDWMTLPEVGPAVGWPIFVILVLIYYAANYMILGALFLGIGGQASRRPSRPRLEGPGQIRPVNKARSENRSRVESQKAPNADCVPVMCATLPSMKSKMLARIMTTPAAMNRSCASSQAATTLTRTPMSVRTLGWMPSATLTLMMARSGNMQTAPTAPVNVIV